MESLEELFNLRACLESKEINLQNNYQTLLLSGKYLNMYTILLRLKIGFD